MTLEDYLENLNKTKKLSEVKRLIIIELWGEGTFPSAWVSSAHLLKVTNQKYFDRRTRELRDEHGVDLDQGVVGGEHSYRMLSSKIQQTNTRAYLSAKDKNNLFNGQNYTCQVCGIISPSGVRGLQADHQIPLSRGGQNDASNWQSLCNECNVAKRRACQGCSETCKTCHWAFPNSNEMPITIRLPKEQFDFVDEQIKKNKNWLLDLIKNNQ